MHPIAVLATVAAASTSSPAITEVQSFGTNPGELKMFEHAPANLPANKPVVLVMHGCSETADNAAATGWNELADQVGFLVVYPEQETANNPLRCFNWAGDYGDPDDITRGKGEALSIKEMVDKAVADHQSDPKRAFVVGFSSGGAMAAVMGATYPDVFAGVGIIAGIPYDCTTTFSEVSTCMKPGKDLSPSEWGDRVRAASPAGPWPRVSIWQGSADQYVGTQNRTELVEQWTNVLGLNATPTANDTVDGQAHSVFKDAKGSTLVETYVVDGMQHGVPVKPADNCGATSSYAIDKGICASKHIAEFFGLTSPAGAPDAGAPPPKSSSSSTSSASSASGGVAPKPDASAPSGAAPAAAAPPAGAGDDGSVDSTCALVRAPSDASVPAFIAVAMAALGMVRRNKKGTR